MILATILALGIAACGLAARLTHIQQPPTLKADPNGIGLMETFAAEAGLEWEYTK